MLRVFSIKLKLKRENIVIGEYRSMGKKRIKELARKVILRIFRMSTGRKGIYGKIGSHNRFTKGVFISEFAILGMNNYFGPYTMINHAIVGNYCSIGPNVKIGQALHSISYITTYQKISSELIGHSLRTKPAIIGSDVWCGANVVIMQGIKVGDGAVIGANAVVTHDIPDYGIAVGIPAKVIKYRFSPEVIEVIKTSRWFYYDINIAKKIVKSLEKSVVEKHNFVKDLSVSELHYIKF
jgi:acetyltransferase-like isoleucine patch superfamily enzyme